MTEGGATARPSKAMRGLLGAYGWIDGRLFGGPDDPTRTVSLEGLAAPGLRTGAAAEVPDIVIRFDGASDHLDQWPVPLYGTWALVHGVGVRGAGHPDDTGLPPSGVEMLRDNPITVSQLVATSAVEQRVIGQVVSRVDKLSLSRGARGHVCKLPRLVSKSVASVVATGQILRPSALR